MVIKWRHCERELTGRRTELKRKHEELEASVAAAGQGKTDSEERPAGLLSLSGNEAFFDCESN